MRRKDVGWKCGRRLVLPTPTDNIDHNVQKARNEEAKESKICQEFGTGDTVPIQRV
jgi:hypothetical protein